MTKLKKISDLVYPEGPIYMKIQICLEDWKVAYKKRGMKGDDSVIKFLEHFGEIKIPPELNEKSQKGGRKE